MRGVDFMIGLTELLAGLYDDLLKDLIELMVVEDAVRIHIYKDQWGLTLSLEASEVVDRIVNESSQDGWKVYCVLLQGRD